MADIVEFLTPGGKKLRELRERTGRSLLDVELDAEIGNGNLSSIERGKRKRVQRETLEKILDALEARFTERKEVLECYGYVVSYPLPTQEEIDWAYREHRSVLDNLTTPAYLIDCATHILAWNPSLEHLMDKLGRPNLLATLHYVPIFYVYLDPALQLRTIIPNLELVLPAMIQTFRQHFWPYREESWYPKLIAKTADRFPHFRDHWPSENALGMMESRSRLHYVIEFSEPGGGILRFRIGSECMVRDQRFELIYWNPVDSFTMEVIEQL